MIVESHRARRGLAITAGITAMAAGAALNVTHLVEGGQPLYSPMTGCNPGIGPGRGRCGIGRGRGVAIGSQNLGVLS